MPPLYKLSYGKTVNYAYNDDELKEMVNKAGKNYTVQRYKGLGEMNPEQLWDTTMNPAKRSIMKVTLEDATEADRLITTLMGDKVDPRRQYITANANFNKTDIFQEMGV
jgi:DNA gyrase subunit B